MKRLLSLFIGLIFGAAMWAAPQIEFAKKHHDFGVLHASKGPVEAVYEFTNNGDQPLVIVAVTNGGCGCTTPRFTLEPVKPGQKGKVVIKFDPTGRKGEFRREVKVKTNAKGGRKKLTFTGSIIP